MEQKRLVTLFGIFVLLVVLPLTMSALGGPRQTVVVEITQPNAGPTATPTCPYAGSLTPTVTGTPPTATRTRTPTPTVTGTPPTPTPTATPTRTGTATPTPTVTYTPRPTNTPGPSPTRVPSTIRRLYLPVVPDEYKRFIGHWSGTTSLGHPVSFDVQEGSLRWNNFELNTLVVSVNCGYGTFRFKITIRSPGDITNDQFSYTTVGYRFTGRFTGGWTAVGTYTFDNYRITFPGPCYEYVNETGTWEAKWQPPTP